MRLSTQLALAIVGVVLVTAAAPNHLTYRLVDTIGPPGKSIRAGMCAVQTFAIPR